MPLCYVCLLVLLLLSSCMAVSTVSASASALTRGGTKIVVFAITPHTRKLRDDLNGGRAGTLTVPTAKSTTIAV
jgi:hypothetical protein